MEATEKSGGLAHALLTLARPSRFDAVDPVDEGVAYTSRDRKGIAPLCDVYLPKRGRGHASVIVVHGGAFVVGHRQMKPVRFVSTHLCRAGFAVCAIDYRLLFRGGGIDEACADVDAAAAFWRKRSSRYGIDPSRISMLGMSAGATLMMLHAGRGQHEYHRLVSFYGPTEFDRIRGRRAEWLLSRVMGSNERSAWKERSPLTHANMRSPVLLFHGTEDRLVPSTHSRRFHQSRVERGLPSELILLEGMRHGWLNDAALPETTQTVERVIEFLRDPS